MPTPRRCRLGISEKDTQITRPDFRSRSKGGKDFFRGPWKPSGLEDGRYKGHHEGNLFCHSVLPEIWRVRIVRIYKSCVSSMSTRPDFRSRSKGGKDFFRGPWKPSGLEDGRYSPWTGLMWPSTDKAAQENRRYENF
jgi:hypothetical protein